MPESNVHKLADESAAENAADNVSSPPQLTVVDPADCLAEAEVIYNYGGFDGKSPLFPCAKEYWYEEGSRRFWLKNAAGEWVDMNSSEFERELRMLGCRAVKLVKEGETSSPLEKVMADIQKNRRVWYAGELAGHKAGIYTLQGKKVLITQSPQLMVPVAGEWANLKKYLENLLVDAESKTDQLIYLHAWVQHTLERLYSGKWAKPGGLCLGVAGPTDCGKTLLTMLLQVLFGGKVANPYEWMIGRDAFNEEMFEACLQLIDDEVADTSIKGRLALAAKIKIMTATGRGRCRGMQKKAVNLAPVWRLMICTNDEPDRLLILPPLDDDIVDKLLLLRAYKRPMPWPASTNADELAAWNGLLGELPHYVHWLLHEFKIPGELHGRFGVRAWQHPEIVGMLQETSPELRQWNFIERVMAAAATNMVNGQLEEGLQKSVAGRLVAHRHQLYGVQWRWKGTANELEGDLKAEGAGLTKDEQREVQKPTWLGRRLEKLAKIKPGGALFVFKHEGATRSWTIRSGPEAPE